MHVFMCDYLMDVFVFDHFMDGFFACHICIRALTENTRYPKTNTEINTHSVDPLGSIDSFATIEIPGYGQTARSRVLLNTTTPIWHQEFTFRITDDMLTRVRND